MVASPPKPDVRLIPLNDLIPTPDNNRFKPDPKALADLADSIRTMGLLQPALARPHPKKRGKFDLRLGSRRLAACRLAGLAEMPVIVRELDDAAAMETTVTENLHREDLHPLEEAAGVQKLLEIYHAAEDVAARLGKTAGWVARRARLSYLIEPFKKLIRQAGGDFAEVGVGVLERLAALPAATQQEVYKLTEQPWRGGRHAPRCFDDVKAFDDYAARELLMKLAAAPWKQTDAELYPKAGACSGCMKRTEAQPLLFSDLAAPGAKPSDRCLDRACFEEKAARALRIKYAAQVGKHPGLVKLDKGPPGEPSKRRVKEAVGKDVRHHYAFRPARKTDKGATPALVVNGPGLGRIEYVKPWNASASAPAKKASGPTSLKERRAECQRFGTGEEGLRADVAQGAPGEAGGAPEKVGDRAGAGEDHGDPRRQGGYCQGSAADDASPGATLHDRGLRGRPGRPGRRGRRVGHVR
jgi:ParB/RepB/Spo0J family partition protein